MEPKFQTSFIPKKPIGSSQGSGIDVIHGTNVFSIAATIILVFTIIISGGLFLYKNFLVNKIKESDKNIIAARTAFEPEKIKELINVNNKIISAKTLLDKHVVVSKALSLMEVLTTKKMRFSELNYTNKEGELILNITGEIQTYNALAEQQNIFLKNEYMKNPVFSNFSLGDNGSILVNFSTAINPSLVSYKKTIQ
jgi:hypothetical protein